MNKKKKEKEIIKLTRKRRNEKIEQLYFNTIHFTLLCGTLVDVCASAACAFSALSVHRFLNPVEWPITSNH